MLLKGLIGIVLDQAADRVVGHPVGGWIKETACGMVPCLLNDQEDSFLKGYLGSPCYLPLPASSSALLSGGILLPGFSFFVEVLDHRPEDLADLLPHLGSGLYPSL